jgi:hypothetical protein
MSREIIAFAKVGKTTDPKDGSRILSFHLGGMFWTNWWERGFAEDKDRRNVAIYFKQHSREMNNYTTNEILELLTPERLSAILDVLPEKQVVIIPNKNWNMFFIHKELKCSHSEAKFIRMALVCPSCGFVGGC